MFWFDRQDERAVFVDKRRERHTLPDISSKGGSRELVIDPTHQADFTDLPFPADTFALVVFDPPHFERNGDKSWVGLKYGTLKGDWREMLRGGFAECFRVLRPEGVLIFKWCEEEIPVSQILALTPQKPLFGHRSGKQQKTHWVAFMKPAGSAGADDVDLSAVDTARMGNKALAWHCERGCPHPDVCAVVKCNASGECKGARGVASGSTVGDKPVTGAVVERCATCGEQLPNHHPNCCPGIEGSHHG